LSALYRRFFFRLCFHIFHSDARISVSRDNISHISGRFLSLSLPGIEATDVISRAFSHAFFSQKSSPTDY